LDPRAVGACALHSFPTRRSSDLHDPLRVRDFGPDSDFGGTAELYPDVRQRIAGTTARHPHEKRGSTRAEGHRAGTRPLEWKAVRSEEHTSELQSRENLVCRLLLE